MIPLVAENDINILHAIGKCRVASSLQLSSLLSIKQRSAKKSLIRLFSLGYVDKLHIERTPPLYKLGKGGEILLKDKVYKQLEINTLMALKYAASTQLYVQFYKYFGDSVSYRTIGADSIIAEIILKRSQYIIVVPRIWSGSEEEIKAAEIIEDIDDKIIIVAGSKEQAEKIARIQKGKENAVRYTWDGILKDGLAFYKKSGNILIESERFRT
ncbi:MAG: hypothetical protein ACPLRZ_11495 [Thermovenabulum sp.]